MTSDKKNISLLADIFVKKGLSNIVISPGSRNAPIILSFVNNKKVNAFSIVDERSAAFFALGMSLQTGMTTAIACTSGSAVLNYASAISEAYYQKVPLLVLTADRPSHLINVGDGQTINQTNVFNNFIKYSYQLPENIDGIDEFRSAEKTINEAINNCMFPEPGPVHINIPFDEPIYNTTNEVITGAVINPLEPDCNIDTLKVKEIADRMNGSAKIMIIGGQNKPDNRLNLSLKRLSLKNNIIILSETTTNIVGDNFIDTIDNVVSAISDEDALAFKPEIIISFGEQVVSKMLKKYLRKNKPDFHWHISASGDKMDTYFSLTEAVKCDNAKFLKALEDRVEQSNSSYSALWKARYQNVNAKREFYLGNTMYSDLKVFDYVLKQLPQNINIHLGNSTPVRYNQLFGCKPGITYNSNRGVSGIDGHVSTAAGYSYYSKELNVLITGDLGFLYDSNGLMNHYLKPNFKIIVINNSGGGIFRFIPGPDTSPNLENFFEVKHNWTAEYICSNFGVNYLKADSMDSLQSVFNDFLNNSSSCSLLEIFTPNEVNGQVLREYFQHLAE